MLKKPMTQDHFKRLPEYGLEDISPDSICCLHYSEGETILREGMAMSGISVVLSGRAKVCASAPNGSHLVLCYYVSDGLIGEIEFMTDSYTATTTIIAITDFECLFIPYCHNTGYLKKNAAFMNRLAKELAGKLIRSSDNFVSAALCTGEERLCSYILQMSHHGIFNDVLADTACSVGISYRHMFRILGQLCSHGLLEKGDYGYRILDREGLAARCHKCPE